MTSQRTKKIIVKNPPEASLVAEFLEYTDSWKKKPPEASLVAEFLEYTDSWNISARNAKQNPSFTGILQLILGKLTVVYITTMYRKT